MTAEAYPLQWPEGWPRHQRRERARFATTFAQARDALIHEVRLMGGRQIVLSTNVPLRQDGLPYANMREPGDPGVAIYWLTAKQEQRCMACDKWDRVQDNARALEKSINAMRGLERWGGSHIVNRAFTGFQRLEAPGDEAWWQVLGVTREASGAEIYEAYRRRRSETHPDRGGDVDEFRRVQRAYDQAISANGTVAQGVSP